LFSSAMIIGQLLLFYFFFVSDFDRTISYKIGNCPILSTKMDENAQDACHKDEDCPGRRICCRTVLGRVCMYPEKMIAVGNGKFVNIHVYGLFICFVVVNFERTAERKGRCPLFNGKVKLDARDQCVRFDDCDENRLCCQTISGKICLKPELRPAKEMEKIRRECPKFFGPKFQNSIDRCDIDEDCERGWTCCDTAGGRRCLLPD
ncbi:WAP four-disulfide core domain protein 8, partial [Trichinella nativa]